MPCMACKRSGVQAPQLHQAQRIFHSRSEHYSPEICQKTRSVVVRTLAVLSGFGGLEGLLSEQLADLTTPRQAPMGAARWPGCGGVRTLPLDGTASRPIGTALPQASGWLVEPGETSHCSALSRGEQMAAGSSGDRRTPSEHSRLSPGPTEKLHPAAGPGRMMARPSCQR
jgi:hypothetical protein